MEELKELNEVFIEFGEVIKMTGDKMKEFFTTTPWQIQLAALVMFVSFVLSIIIRLKFHYKTRGERRIEKAKALGHAVNGTVVSASFNNDEKGNRSYHGRIEYEVDGRRYATVIAPSNSGTIYKGETYTVYWVDNPKRGFTTGNSEGFLGIMEYLLVNYGIPVFLAFLTLLLTGGLQK